MNNGKFQNAEPDNVEQDLYDCTLTVIPEEERDAFEERYGVDDVA